MKKFILISFLTCLNYLLQAQPSIQWQKCYGDSLGYDGSNCSVKTNDGGSISIGESKGKGGTNVSNHHGSTDSIDVWVVKVDSLGAVQWENSYGGTYWDWGFSIIQTSDGGYAFAGCTYSNNGDIVGKHGSGDVWVVKLDPSGNIQWQKCLGGSGAEYGESIAESPYGGYYIGATTYSNDGDVIGYHGLGDAWITHLDAAGNLKWARACGGTSHEGKLNMSLQGLYIRDLTIISTADGGCLFSTNADSHDGDVAGHHGTSGMVQIGNTIYGYNDDSWLVKMDSLGNISWERSLGGTYIDRAAALIQSTDGNYVVAGSTSSSDGDVSGLHLPGVVQPIYDIWLVKVDVAGTLLWQKCYGGTNHDVPYGVSNTSDGGYFIAGRTASNNGDVTGNHGGPTEGWVVKTDATGSLQWAKTLGGSKRDFMSGGYEASDGGFIVIGTTSSKNFDVIGNHSADGAVTNLDVWLVKLEPTPKHFICGKIYEDLNNNCVQDSLEIGLAGRMVKTTPGNYFATTDANGNYTMYVDTGSYTVSHIPPAFYAQSCPGSPGTYNANIFTPTPNSFNNDYADTLTVHCADLNVNIATTTIFRPCLKNVFTVSYCNTGSLPDSNVVVSLTFDPGLTPLSSTIPWNQNGNVYAFTIGVLQPGQCGMFHITDSVSCGLTFNTILCVWASVTGNMNECNLANNNKHYCDRVWGSCDPNSKDVTSQVPNTGFVTSENITFSDTLNYMIRFQNVGSDTAFKVVIRDTLSSYVDPATVVLGAASHGYTFRIYGQGILEWTFNNILLPDSTSDEVGSHGFVQFSVQQKPGNIMGTDIENSAAIWFDYNEPVLTNSTHNTIPFTTGIALLTNENALYVYPNPVGKTLNIEISSDLHDKKCEVHVLNILGEEVSQKLEVQGGRSKLDVSNLQEGVYFVKLAVENKTFVKKVVVQH